MEPAKNEAPKLPDMVMCGDHPSFTKTELNVKEKPDEEKKRSVPYTRISPSSSRTGGASALGVAAGGGGEARRGSEAALRVLEARRRARSLDAVPRQELDVSSANRALLQAAMGSFRWPPYLLAVWVVVLVLTHAIHCLVTMLERALPNVRRFCQYFRAWTEEAWKVDTDVNHRVYPLALALLTGMLYALYFGLYVLYSVALWSIEPLCAELEDKQSSVDVMETKVTNYVDEIGSKTNLKH